MILGDISIGDTVTGKGFETGEVIEADDSEALVELPSGELVVRSLTVLRRPKVPAPIPTTKLQHLTCAKGHDWTRPSQKGKPPKYCPDHAPVPSKPAEGRTERPKAIVVYSSETDETLHCEAGDHDWTRKRQRGKKPVNCPKHSTVSKSVPPVDDSLIEFADYDAKLKLDYIRKELERGRSPGDASGLIQTRGDILRRLQQRRDYASVVV